MICETSKIPTKCIESAEFGHGTRRPGNPALARSPTRAGLGSPTSAVTHSTPSYRLVKQVTVSFSWRQPEQCASVALVLKRLMLVTRSHIDLLRVASAACPAT
ncbi:putative leader peptide [Frankia tisae]|uniref:putative leader peptide n=1 Tax=Frankia tisae TaxID=2950104 RepID=UPI0034D5A87F